MRKISKPTQIILEAEERMKKCCLEYLGDCDGKIEWHHNVIYAGKQSDVPETILGVCKKHHDQANNSIMKERLDYQMLKLFNPRTFDMFPKSSLRMRKYYLIKKYGNSN